MEFKMNAVIHRGNDYENSLRTFQNKRFGYLEQEIRAFDVETLRLLLYDIQKRGRTIETLTGMAV
jgi:hypothetical protein